MSGQTVLLRILTLHVVPVSLMITQELMCWISIVPCPPFLSLVIPIKAKTAFPFWVFVAFCFCSRDAHFFFRHFDLKIS